MEYPKIRIGVFLITPDIMQELKEAMNDITIVSITGSIIVAYGQYGESLMSTTLDRGKSILIEKGKKYKLAPSGAGAYYIHIQNEENEKHENFNFSSPVFDNGLYFS